MNRLALVPLAALLAAPAPARGQWQAEIAHELKGHTNAANRVSLSRDGKWLVSGGDDGKVVSWELGGKRVTDRVLTTYNEPVPGVGITPRGEFVAAVNSYFWGSSVRLARPDGGSLGAIGGFKHGGGDALCLDVSPAGHLLAVGVADQSVRVWATVGQQWVGRRGNPRVDLPHSSVAGKGPVRAVAFSSGEKVVSLAAGTRDGNVTVYRVSPPARPGANPAVNESPVKFDPHAKPVRGIAFDPTDPDVFATAGADGRVVVRNARTGATVRSADAAHGAVNGLAYAPDGRHYATCGEDGAVRVWDAGTGAKVLDLKPGDRPLRGVAFSPDGRSLAAAGADFVVRVWSLKRRAAPAATAGLPRAARR